ncbi:MAG: flagellar basal body L-ring protein FlgH [Proteobacteria bacterium]|nr:flagellar basal body L-ring protein FlgH [Pseudomonadota bacterium]NOG58924.1 flagellar basal body L-ring protein FlgH [Pseudomonadota bacterium]
MNKHPVKYKVSIVFMMLCSLLLVSACQTQAKRDPAFAAVRPTLPPVEPESNGSIYKPGFDVRLFEDIKARRVGDILTVVLNEATNAEKEATTDVTKAATSTITNPTILGTTPEFDLPKFMPLSATQSLNLGTSLSSDHSLGGSGEADQNHLLTGNITVSVVEVLPNGNLIIRGEKRVTLNNGVEYIQLSGIVRQIDVLTNNTVLSTQVADATINYIGEGAIADSNKNGWLARFFNSPLMPF